MSTNLHGLGRAILEAIASTLFLSTAIRADVQTIASGSDRAPGVPLPTRFLGFGTPRINNASQIVFQAFLTTTGGVTANNDTGLWAGSSGNLRLVAREGSAPPGLPDLQFGTFSGTINDPGQVSFFSFLRGAGVTASNDSSVWSETAGGLTLLAREADQALGAPPGAVFQTIPGPATDGLGRTICSCELRVGAGGVTSDNESGVWAGTPGNLQLIVREGQQAPDFPAGILFSDIRIPAVMNATGQIALTSFMRKGLGLADDPVAIWFGTPGALKGIASGTSPVPGTLPGTAYSFFGLLFMNNAGQIAVGADLAGNYVTTDNNRGIFILSDGNAKLVARKGDQAPGVETGAVFSSLGSLAGIDSADRVSFAASLKQGVAGITPGNDSAIWVGLPGNLHVAAREGSQAPGTPSGAVFGQLDNLLSVPVANSTGQVVFQNQLLVGQGGVMSDTSRGIWISDMQGETLLVARAGDPIGSRTIGILNMSDHSINDFGQVAFFASTIGPGDVHEGVHLFTPDLRWRAASGGNWDDPLNWTLSIRPAHVHKVSISVPGGAVVSGPTQETTVRSLDIGSSDGSATLLLGPVALTINETLNVDVQSGIVASAGARLLVGRDFLIHGASKNAWETDDALLRFLGNTSHTLSIAGADFGSDYRGYFDNFALGTLVLDATDGLVLADGNAEAGGALYVKQLLLPAGVDQITNITGNGLSIYYDIREQANAYLFGRTFSLAGGGIIAPVPEPAPASLAIATIAICARRRRRMIGI